MARTWFQPGLYVLDYPARNRPGTPAAQRGSDQAALARRARTRPVTLARSAADETPVPAAPARPVAS